MARRWLARLPFLLRRALPLLLLALAPLAGAAPAAAAPAMLHVVQAQLLRQASAAAAPAPAVLDSRALPGAWTAVELPYAPSAQLLRQAGAAFGAGAAPGSAGAAGPVTTTWLRVTLAPFAPPATALNLYVARIKVFGTIAVYLDGKLIDQRQLGGPTWYWEPLWLPLDGGRRAAAPREIVLRLQHQRSTDAAVASMWLGSADAIAWRYQGRQWLQLYLPVMGVGAFLAVGLFAALVWLRRGSGAGYGLFALLSMVQFVRALSFFSDARMSSAWFAWLMLNSLFWSICIVHAFQVFTHGRRQRWLSLGLFTLAMLVAVCSLPPLSPWFTTPQMTPLIYVLGIIAGVTVSVAGLLAAWRRSLEGLMMTAGVALCVVYGINDWALQNNFLGVEGWYLGPYMNLQNFGMLCYLMYRRYRRAEVQVQRSNVELAGSLQRLETELAGSYERLRQVEYLHTVAEERQRLMQDMHDGLGSSLHSALRAIERGRLDALAVADILRSCIDDLHLTIDALEPVAADLLLLLATLRFRLAGRLDSAGVVLRWDVADVAPLDWIDPPAALHILRILQEALTNIVKHTAATEISLATTNADDGVLIVVADNGAGFDLAAALARGGNGLSNQRRRAAAVGGTLRWESGAAGTRVQFWMPATRSASALATSAASPLESLQRH